VGHPTGLPMGLPVGHAIQIRIVVMKCATHYLKHVWPATPFQTYAHRHRCAPMERAEAVAAAAATGGAQQIAGPKCAALQPTRAFHAIRLQIYANRRWYASQGFAKIRAPIPANAWVRCAARESVWLAMRQPINALQG